MSSLQGQSYSELRRANEACVAIINATWGAKVAYIEDVRGHNGFIWPTIKSSLVCGMVPGRRDAPPFNGGAEGRVR